MTIWDAKVSFNWSNTACIIIKTDYRLAWLGAVEQAAYIKSQKRQLRFWEDKIKDKQESVGSFTFKN